MGIYAVLSLTGVINPSAVASGDILNAFSFFLVAGFFAYFFHRERIRNYLKSNHYHFMAHIDHLDHVYDDYYYWGDDRFEKAEAAVGRIGGDEFAVLAGGPDPMDRVEKIKDAICAIELPDGRTITCSVGCVWVSENQSIQSVYKDADDVLYAAKKNGRGRIVYGYQLR